MNVQSLPPELLEMIALYLAPRDIPAFESVCNSFLNSIRTPNFWRSRIKEEYCSEGVKYASKAIGRFNPARRTKSISRLADEWKSSYILLSRFFESDISDGKNRATSTFEENETKCWMMFLRWEPPSHQLTTPVPADLRAADLWIYIYRKMRLAPGVYDANAILGSAAKSLVGRVTFSVELEELVLYPMADPERQPKVRMYCKDVLCHSVFPETLVPDLYVCSDIERDWTTDGVARRVVHAGRIVVPRLSVSAMEEGQEWRQVKVCLAIQREFTPEFKFDGVRFDRVYDSPEPKIGAFVDKTVNIRRASSVSSIMDKWSTCDDVEIHCESAQLNQSKVSSGRTLADDLGRALSAEEEEEDQTPRLPSKRGYGQTIDGTSSYRIGYPSIESLHQQEIVS
ncbi:uncharacterized protein V1516DRAFT_663598 [Lipomyces oligophaga]|uniref:uncharacterized protein n=1 Tax=Lipomyces oligophaga TaxID=45792 RepID=UPI0034CEDB99